MRSQAQLGPVSRPRSIDDLDRGVIEELQRNGREPFRRIATRLGVAEATVRTRYERLVADGVLQVIGVTNPLALGFDATAMIGVRTSGSPEAVAEKIGGWPEVTYLVVVAGQFDLLVETVCSDLAALLDLTGRLRVVEGVASTETFLYLKLCKQLYDWGTRQ
jgi:Lrp/AsnC family transcriptional regulator, regulator for asnA, asnC and gidA